MPICYHIDVCLDSQKLSHAISGFTVMSVGCLLLSQNLAVFRRKRLDRRNLTGNRVKSLLCRLVYDDFLLMFRVKVLIIT